MESEKGTEDEKRMKRNQIEIKQQMKELDV